MKGRMVFFGATLLLSGCGPNLQSLLPGKHYREAVCAADEGNDDDKRIVGNALDKDADFQLGMHVVSNDELRLVLDATTDDAAKRGKIVRVVVQSNVLPVDDVELNGSFVTNDGRKAALGADWVTLAWMTHEELPPNRIEDTYVTGENLLKGTAAVFTVGLSLLFTNFRPGKIVTDPLPSDYARVAPHASALHATVGDSRCQDIGVADGMGTRCTWYFVVDAGSNQPISFQLDARYISVRKTGKPRIEDEEKCRLVRTIQIPLGPPTGLETAVLERFGERVQSVRAMVPRH